MLRRLARRLLTRWGIIHPTLEETGALLMRMQLTGRVTREDLHSLAHRGIDLRGIVRGIEL